MGPGRSRVAREGSGRRPQQERGRGGLGRTFSITSFSGFFPCIICSETYAGTAKPTPVTMFTACAETQRDEHGRARRREQGRGRAGARGGGAHPDDKQPDEQARAHHAQRHQPFVLAGGGGERVDRRLERAVLDGVLQVLRRVRDGGGRIGEVLGEPALRRQAPWLMPLSCDDTRRSKKQRLLGG